MHRFVDGCNDIGIACCTTVVVVDPNTQQVLYTKQVHTSNTTAVTDTETGGSGGSSGGTNTGAVVGGVLGGLAGVVCAAGTFVCFRRRRRQRAAVGAAQRGAYLVNKPSPKAGMAVEESAALATLPTKPSGQSPASMASLLQQMEAGGGAEGQALPEQDPLLSYITSLVRRLNPLRASVASFLSC